MEDFAGGGLANTGWDCAGWDCVFERLENEDERAGRVAASVALETLVPFPFPTCLADTPIAFEPSFSLPLWLAAGPILGPTLESLCTDMLRRIETSLREFAANS